MNVSIAKPVPPISKKSAVGLIDLLLVSSVIGVIIEITSFFFFDNPIWIVALIACNLFRFRLQKIFAESGAKLAFVFENLLYFTMAWIMITQIPNYGLYFGLPWLSLLFVDVVEYFVNISEGSTYRQWRRYLISWSEYQKTTKG